MWQEVWILLSCNSELVLNFHAGRIFHVLAAHDTHTLPCLCSRRPTGWLCMYGSSIPSSIWFRTMCSSLLHHSCDWSSPPTDASSSCERHSLKPSNCSCKGRIFPKSPIRPIIMVQWKTILNERKLILEIHPILHWVHDYGRDFINFQGILALFLLFRGECTSCRRMKVFLAVPFAPSSRSSAHGIMAVDPGNPTGTSFAIGSFGNAMLKWKEA